MTLPGGYELDDDRARLDLDAAWDLIERYACWARSRTRDVVERQLAGSWRVLPVMRAHGGRVERRLRGSDGQVEVHVLRFPSAEALDAYRADPGRAAVAHLFEQSGTTMHLQPVADLPPG